MVNSITNVYSQTLKLSNTLKHTRHSPLSNTAGKVLGTRLATPGGPPPTPETQKGFTQSEGCGSELCIAWLDLAMHGYLKFCEILKI